MTDNTAASAPIGVGDTFAAKDIAGVKYPRNILTTAAGVDITPLAEGGAVSVSNFPATQPVSIAATVTTTATVANFPASQAVTGPATDAQLRATPLPVSGTVTVGNASLPVTGAFYQATQPVSIAGTVTTTGPLTDTQLRATAVPVSLASTTITGSVAVTGTFWQATQPVSFTQQALPANQSVNVAQMGGIATSMNTGVRDTGTQRVTIATNDVVPVTGTFWQTTQPVSGTVSVTGSTVTNVINTAQGAATHHHLISAASTNLTSVKASAGTVNAIVLTNSSAAIKYFKLYNKASAPVSLSDTPVATIGVPTLQTVVFPCGAFGMRFSTGIAYATTGLITVTDSTAVASGDLAIHIQYI